MSVKPNPDPASTNQMPGLPLIVWNMLVFIAFLTSVGGVLRAVQLGNWDWQTLLFFLASAIILVLPWAKKLKFSSSGLEVELGNQIKELAKATSLMVEFAPSNPQKHPDAEKAAYERAIFPGLIRDMPVPEPIRLPTKVELAGKKTPEDSISLKTERNPLKTANVVEQEIQEDDPQKGKWGGSEIANYRRISATVKPVTLMPNWFLVRLFVSAADLSKPLAGNVTFHLHPTFKKNTATVRVMDGKAELELVAWGAFTVGAECDNGATKLELDLATLPDAPDTFRSR